MSDFQIGDRVRAKHDHTFEGEYRGESDRRMAWIVPTPLLGPREAAALLPESWFEPVPKPLNPLVPWDVLDDELRKCYTPRNSDSIKSELRARLRERGYGPAEETR